MDKKQHLKKLYQKLAIGSIDQQELEWLRTYFNSGDAEILLELIREELEAPHELGADTSEERQVFERVYQQIAEKRFASNRTVTRPILRWSKIAIAASIIAVLGFGAIQYIYHKNYSQKDLQTLSQDIAPGEEGATLTLADGKKIRLSTAAQGNIAIEDAVKITKTADGQIVYEISNDGSLSDKVNTLSTSNGQTFAVILPDKSKVWLNSGSSISYTTTLLEKGVRKVNLTGEAYFEVAKSTQPFVVISKNQQVEVLGTHFNINAYADEANIRTTLLEGSVKVNSGQRMQTLKPGQQAINSSSELNVVNVNTENITDWKDGDFNLDNLNFRVAMRKIARWYDVDIIYDAKLPDNVVTGGWVSRNKKLSEVLKLIESSGQVHFKIEGRKVYIYP